MDSTLTRAACVITLICCVFLAGLGWWCVGEAFDRQELAMIRLGLFPAVAFTVISAVLGVLLPFIWRDL